MSTVQPLSPLCDFCGLPVIAPRWRNKPSTSDDLPVFCCSGCRLAAAILSAEDQGEAAQRTLLRLGFAAFCTMNVLAFSMALWGRDIYGRHASDATELANAIDQLFRYATLLFALPVLILLGGPLLASVWQAIRRGVITSDILILLGVVAAYALSTVSVIRGEGRIYYEVGCVVLAFVTLGRWFEANGKVKMGHALDSLAKLLPDSVHQVDGDVVRDVPRSSLQVGDEFRVLAGERCGVDGRIVAGFAEIDEQLVTGESRAVTKGPGDSVFSGTLNLDGDLLAIVTAAAGEETVSRLLAMVQRARRAPGQYQRLADRIAVWFVPTICLVALATAAYRGRLEDPDAGILAGLAVVLIACPCALGLATPMAVWTAMSRAAQGHVLFRSGQSLEQLADANIIFLDKTGTLTDGNAEVDALILDQGTDRNEILEYAAALAAGSNHVLSKAVRGYLNEDVPNSRIASVSTVPGKGLSARIFYDNKNDTVYLGSLRYLEEQGLSFPRFLEQSIENIGTDTSLAYIGWDERVRGVFVFRERLRPEASAAIESLHNMKLRTAVLTGDRASRAQRLKIELRSPVMGDLLPDGKVAVVERARGEGHCVAMVGDGVNDAPALAAAEVGIAMGCGADLSRDSAAVCLLSNDLARLPWTISLARQTMHIIRQNLFWAFVYNVGGIALAVSGRLNPVWAGAAMVASSLLVITNSLRLNRFPEPPLATPLAIGATLTNLHTSCQQSQSFGSDLAILDSSVQEFQAMT